MTTDNSIKLLSAICLLLAFLIISTSCSDRYDTYEDIFSDLEDDYETAPEQKLRYTVVIPADSSPELYNAAQSLCSDIESKAYANVDLKYDYQELTENSCDKLILIGRTRFEQSESFLRSFRTNDYGYVCEENTIIIGGASHASSVSAIERFRQNILTNTNQNFLIADGTQFVFTDTYDIKNIFLNGFELCEYTLVYPDNYSVLYGYTLKFRDALADASGYYLDVKSDSDIPKEKRAIAIGNTKLGNADVTELSKTNAKLVEYPTGVSLFAGSDYALERALNELLNRLTVQNGSKTVIAQIHSESLSLFSQTELNIMEIDLNEAEPSIKDIIDISRKISNASPDLIRLVGTSQASAKRILTSAGENYESLILSSNNGYGVYHIYSKNDFKASLKNIGTLGGNAVSKAVYNSIKDDTVLEIYDLFCNATPNNVAKLLDNALTNADTDNAVIFVTGSESDLPTSNLNKLSNGIYSNNGSFIECSATYENNVRTLHLTLYY